MASLFVIDGLVQVPLVAVIEFQVNFECVPVEFTCTVEEEEMFIVAKAWRAEVILKLLAIQRYSVGALSWPLQLSSHLVFFMVVLSSIGFYFHPRFYAPLSLGFSPSLQQLPSVGVPLSPYCWTTSVAAADCFRTTPIRNSPHVETYSLFGRRYSGCVAIDCIVLNIRYPTEHSLKPHLSLPVGSVSRC